MATAHPKHRFLSFVAPSATPTAPTRSVARLAPCIRFTNSGQVTFLPAHHPKSLRPATYQNNDAAYEGVPCVDTVLGMPYGADPAEDAEYLRTNLENYEADEGRAIPDPEYQIEEGNARFYSLSANNLDYDAECNNDAAAHWLRARGYY
jgi:hypothetical protein